MLKSYVLYPDGKVKPLDTLEAGIAAWRDDSASVWFDVEGFDGELDRLAEAFSLAPETVEDCRIGEQRPRMDEYPGYLFLLLYGAVGGEEPPAWAPRKLGLIHGDRFLITTHEQPVRILNELHSRFSRISAQPLERGLAFLFYIIIDGLVDNYMACAESFEDILDRLEDESLKDDPNPDLPEQLSACRWDLIDFRRRLVSLRELLVNIMSSGLEQLTGEQESRFLHVQDHAMMAFERVEGLREIMQAIRDNYHVRIEERTNAMMRILTIFATVMLPLTIITGIYGMNIVLYPATDSPLTTLFVFGLMFAVAGGLLGFFRWRNWL
jgi:magnesium transporter